MLKKNIFTIVILQFLGVIVTAQNNDSIHFSNGSLEEIVISAQHNPQAVNKSITNVTIINREMIDRQGGTNLADVLNQKLNINIIPNVSTGKSGIKMSGLGSQYFKILVDNIPLVNEEGFGNNTDLTQINLDDIAQIEIIEGSMGVDYGSNAATGIINIITKKSSHYDWEISPSIQEETVGREFNFRNKGRHVKSLKVGHRLTDDLYASLSYTHNDFKGFWDDRKGKHHELSDDKRGHSWYPKAQNNFKGLFNYTKDDYRVYYKVEFFDEILKRYNPLVFQNYDPPTDLANPSAIDNIDNTKRIYNHLNTSGRIYDVFNFDVSLSYQTQTKSVDNYKYWILADEKFDEKKYITGKKEVFYSKGLISEFINNKYFNLQLGYETSIDKGFSSALQGMFNEKDIDKKMRSLDFFTSSEIFFNDNFSIRPGYRYMTSNFLGAQHSMSLSAKYLFKGGYELRGHIGMSPRFPNFDELYTYFVDINHDVQGNEDLNPEKALSYNLNLKKTVKLSDDVELDNNLSIRGLNVADLIDLVAAEGNKYTYKNMNDFQDYGITYNGKINYSNLTAGVGVTISGSIKEMHQNPTETNKMLYSTQVNANLGYTLSETGTSLYVFYKLNGAEYKYALKPTQSGVPSDNPEYIKAKQDTYSILDATISQKFYKKKFAATLGVRNILDVKSTPTTPIAVSAHTVGDKTQALLYGASVFVKLQYFLNI